MPKAKPIASLTGLMHSDDEQSDEDIMMTPDSNQENKAAARSKKPVKASNAARKPCPAGKRLSGGNPAARKNAPGSKRAPLREQENEEQMDDTEEVDEFEDETSVAHPPKKAASVAPIQKKPAKKVQRASAKLASKNAVAKTRVAEDEGFEYTPTRMMKGKGRTNAKGKLKAVKTEDDEEMHDGPMEEDTLISIEAEDVMAPAAEPQSHRPTSSSRRQPMNATSGRRRAGSASDTESGSSANLRKKLGEMTRKFESMELKYHNLRNVGVKEAEANFDKLKKQSEERARVANNLIESLRAELAAQKTIAADSRAQTADFSSTQRALQDAQARVTELNTALTAQQNDNRTLQAKLTAARAASANVEASGAQGRRQPVSANGGASGGAGPLAQMKEEMYGDLTGLIMRSIEKQDGIDTYDCIQTGRNGTLHFKLAVEDDSTATASGVAFEDVEFTYTPLLDDTRDRDLISILPEFLTEEITFSRAHAAKFYSRVLDTMNRRIVD